MNMNGIMRIYMTGYGEIRETTDGKEITEEAAMAVSGPAAEAGGFGHDNKITHMNENKRGARRAKHE